MTDLTASQQILARLERKAAEFDKPQVRLASINRLKLACDAIVDEKLGRNVSISPSSVEKYVRKRRDEGLAEWTGPTRVFISSDADLRAYVAAREDERHKPTDLRKRPSQRQRDIEDAISSINSVEMRQIVRHELEDGRVAKRRLEILSKGLRTLPAIDVDALLRGDTASSAGQNVVLPAHGNAGSAAVRSRDMDVIAALLDRFNDGAEMARVGLDCDGKRLSLSSAPRPAMIRPDEMAALRRFDGIVLQPADAPSGPSLSPAGRAGEPKQCILPPNQSGEQ